MFKKLPSTSYRALAIALLVIIVVVLLIAYDLWTGTIHGTFGYAHDPTWEHDPVFFVFSIGSMVIIVILCFIGWYYSLLDAVRYHRNKALSGGK